MALWTERWFRRVGNQEGGGRDRFNVSCVIRMQRVENELEIISLGAMRYSGKSVGKLDRRDLCRPPSASAKRQRLADGRFELAPITRGIRPRPALWRSQGRGAKAILARLPVRPLRVSRRRGRSATPDRASVLLRRHSRQGLHFDGAEVRTQLANVRRKTRRKRNPKRISIFSAFTVAEPYQVVMQTRVDA